MTEPSRAAELATTAAELAAAAASSAGVDLVDGPDLTGEQLGEMSRLFDAVWQRDVAAMGGIISREVLWVLVHTGGQVTAAFAEGRMVGGTAAFLGQDDGGLHLHSHLSAVVAEHAGRGVGRALKLHQMAWCRSHGLNRVLWTFDPLVRRNAVFNLLALGARPVEFHEDLYGPMADGRNVGFPTDRFLVEWDLDDRRVERATAGDRTEPDLAALRHSGAQMVLDVGDDDAPVMTLSEAPRQLARVPADVEALRVRRPDLGHAWTQALRSTIGAAVRGGYRVSGITRDGVYLLADRRGVEELR
jgi:predicted GNAT superfamily acetyltransferase